jgi:KUP system potassium uptake protein
MYGIELLTQHPRGFWLLGAVFLCTTGAEALYSDLGHCGRNNIQVSWIFVKTTLVLNYLGQAAWALLQHKNSLDGINPFFAIVPNWFLLPSVLIATAASIIASQALISGSFTLISEAISLGFWPRVKLKYPTNVRGQIYIPSINWILFVGCTLVVLYFKTSEAMTAAYGFSITVAMLMTTVLMFYYLRYLKHYPFWIVGAIITIFACVETSFFVANAVKLLKRLFFLVFEIGLITTMYVWYNARKMTLKLLSFVYIKDYLALLEQLSNDKSIPKFATHLVYLTKSGSHKQIEKRIMESVFSHSTKRADIYWFLNFGRADDPFTMEYSVEPLLKDKVMRVDFRLGFRIQPKIGIMFRKVVEEMLHNREINLDNCFPSLNANASNDFRFIILERFLSYDNEFAFREGFILNTYFSIIKLAQSDSEAYGIDSDQAVVEKVPLVVAPVTNINLKRIKYRNDPPDF